MTRIDMEVEAMAVGPWNLRTVNDYSADEVVSSLQKTIRRADCDGAVFWAHELNLSGLGGWAWRRIFTICSEDVGLAQPDAPAVIAGLWTASQVLLANQRKPVPSEKVQYPWLQLLQAAWYLARCPKNRELADMATLFDIRQQRHQLLEIPDIGLDEHTRRGRAMGRGAAHFEDDSPNGARWVANETEIDGNRWKAMFYQEWTPPKDPASRSYKVVDPAPEKTSDRPPK
jgi:replication-associated recombination protein RarA